MSQIGSDSTSFVSLLMHDDRDIRSGAAAAVAKLGLAGRDRDKADDQTETETDRQGQTDRQTGRDRSHLA